MKVVLWLLCNKW